MMRLGLRRALAERLMVMARRTTWNVVLVAGQAWVWGLAGLAGCTVGPDYVKPEVETPAAFEAQQDKAAAAGAGGAADLVAWWKKLGDAKLDELVARALEENKDLRLASARVLEARGQRGVTASELVPTLNQTGSYSDNRSSKGGGTGRGIPGTESDFFVLGLESSWEIDLWGRIRRNVEAADASIGATMEARRGVIVSLLADVATNYVNLRSFQQRLLIALQNVKTQSDTLGLTESRFKAGLTSELDVARARTNLATTQSQIPTLQAGVRASIFRLSTLIGRPPGVLVAELDPTGTIPKGPGQIPAGLPSELLLRRPDVRQAERELAAATARIGVATADLYPRFSLTGSFGFANAQAGHQFDSPNRFWSFGPAYSWPIFQGGRIRSNIRVQETRTEEALLVYERAVLLAFEDVERSMVNFAREQDRRGYLAEAVASADRSTVLATDLYSKGLADFISVLDAQRQLFQLQDQLVASESTVTTNLISVYRALGGGWEEPEPASETEAVGAVPQ